MAMKIAILEDNGERVEIMLSCLQDRFRQYEARFFDDARDMNAFLKENLEDTILLSLDHDLELKPGVSGETVDPGTGREVADWLARTESVCPVIIHTTNSSAALGMEMVLKDAGWKTYRVVPYDDMKWITEAWFPTVRQAIVGTARTAQKEAR